MLGIACAGQIQVLITLQLNSFNTSREFPISIDISDIKSSIATLDNNIGRIINPIEVITSTTNHLVSARTTIQGIISVTSDELIGTISSTEVVITNIAKNVVIKIITSTMQMLGLNDMQLIVRNLVMTIWT